MEWVVKPTNPAPSPTAKDMVLITYADMLQSECDNLSSLSVLREFCTARLKGAVSAIHILPFYPWTSDDGFSVVDYREVCEEYGNWERRFQTGGGVRPHVRLGAQSLLFQKPVV